MTLPCRVSALFGAILVSTLAACAPGPRDLDRASFLPVSEYVSPSALPAAYDPPLHANETPELRALINEYADFYDVPRKLVHRVVIRESTHRPGARNGPYYGLMQILPATARSMGFAGQPADLLDPETNLKYAVKYLRGAWLLSDGSHDAAVMWYAKGYYYEAKRRGMLVETGLRSG